MPLRKKYPSALRQPTRKIQRRPNPYIMAEPNLQGLHLKGTISQAILSSLTHEPRQTSLHLSHLYKIDRNGNESGLYSPKKNKHYLYPRSYFKVRNWLTRNSVLIKPGQRVIAPDGKVLRHPRAEHKQGYVYSLSHVYAMNPRRSNLDHELDCAWIWVSYAPHIDHWDYDWEEDELFHYDRRMSFRDYAGDFFIEMHRGTEPIIDEEDRLTPIRKDNIYYQKSFNGKIDKYIDFYNRNRDAKFKVLIVVSDCSGGTLDPHGTVRLADDVVNLIDFKAEREPRYRELFLVTTLAKVIADPLGKIWCSAAAPTEPVSIHP